MEVASSQPHNHQTHHHHHQHHNSNQNHHQRHMLSTSHFGSSSATAGGGVAGGEGARSPFQREVREWQRIDPNTGALLSGRLEADRWISGPLSSYGKISDSQNISQPDGTQHTQRKQLEVLQARTQTGGAMQVIRSQTVQTTSSRWSSSSSNSSPNTTLLLTTNATSSSNSNSTSGPNTNHSFGSTNPHLNSHSNHLANIQIPNNGTNHQHSHYHNSQQQQQQHHWSESTNSTARRNSGIKITEVSNDEDDDEDGMEIEATHLNYMIDDGDNSLSSSSGHNNNNNLTRHAHTLHTVNGNNNSSSHNLLLPDTAPSIKLSNLMKSSSSISSNSNGSNNSSSNAALNMNGTHPATNSNKISLHAIVGDGNTKSSSSTVSSWQQQQQRNSQLYKQPVLFGNNNKYHSVGVNAAVDDDDHDDDENYEARGFGGAGGVAVQTTPTHLQNRQPLGELESFRHYNERATALSASMGNAADDDDDLRLSARHQRRQQAPCSTHRFSVPLQRNRSISTDDLSTEWETIGADNNQEPTEWKRVSKLRRSFQSHNSKAKESQTPQRNKPVDLPANSVSVARIRAELESGRRLHTAMRNNQLDMNAIDSILHGTERSGIKASPTPKRNSFLTAESLKEIRGKLKRLSDETLYKEDFVAHQQPPAQDEHIEIQQIKKIPLPKPISPTSAFQTVRPVQHTTHSLESRQKPRDNTSAEWHLRRKSYGFEKMSPPDNKTMYRMDASTDSGLGRSGELGNWSPTEVSPSSVRGTVIQFGQPAQIVRNTTTRYRQIKSPDLHSSDENSFDKRHSIAGDEMSYVKDNVRKTSQVHLNGFSESELHNSSTMFQRSQHKRVEFCKTEVHFAAESGRVNIVETDGKPPPTNNFRRRRRATSGPLQSLVKSVSTVSSESETSTSGISVFPITRFGDDDQRPNTLLTYKTPDPEADAVTISTQETFKNTSESLRHSYSSTSGIESTDNENEDISAIRGILKNKPIKPKPYHLGENIESADALWGVQLKPIGGKHYEASQDSNPNGYSTKINLNLGEAEVKTNELPKSNVMSIELHSPQSTLKKTMPSSKPVAKPRTISNVTSSSAFTNDQIKEPLTIIKEVRGARKLREHELSYFGVQTKKSEDKPQTPTLKRNDNPLERQSTNGHWHLLNDKPDLLIHSEIAVKPQKIYKAEEIRPAERKSLQEEEDHFYENISRELRPVFKVKTCQELGSYDRKSDHQRDEMILSEMSRNADQTLKALNQEAALKDHRRRSLHRRNSKPLETIDEKSNSEKLPPEDLGKINQSNSRAAEVKRPMRHSSPSPISTVASRARSNSNSSVEECPRARSRSLSSEREYEHFKMGTNRTSRSVKSDSNRMFNSRSSSLDSQNQYSSAEEEFNKQIKDRSSQLSKRSSAGMNTYKQSPRLNNEHPPEAPKRRQRSAASSTVHSSQRERMECKKDAKALHTTTSSSATNRNVSNNRRRREGDKNEIQHCSPRPSSKKDSISMSPGIRPMRSSTQHHHDASSSHHHRSSNRSERNDKDIKDSKEKEKLSKSKGQSSRSTSHNHHSERHSSNMTPIKSREHKKASATTTTTTGSNSDKKAQTSNDLIKLDKNSAILNGQVENGHRHHHHTHHHHPTVQHVHSLKQTTITAATAKPRERSGKNRK